VSDPPVPIGASAGQIEAAIAKFVSVLRLDEKIAILSGHGFLEQIAAAQGKYCDDTYHIGGGNERLGIPTFQFMDGPRGVAMGESTCFPVPMARGASFDVDLEERIGDAIGRELRAQGANLFGGVCINLLRHPAWGRAQETYGEDPVLLGEMGAALVRGVQRHNVVATPKHFAANSIENARFHVNVRIDERALREVYLPHFKRCIDEGALAIMSAYNRLNGSHCGHNKDLLTKILKNEWGFEGFVYSDFVLGCRGTDACAAGLDVEAPDTIHFGSKLEEAVRVGGVEEARIDDAVARVFRALFTMTSRPDPESYGSAQVACSHHVSLAREAAEKSIVLLENRDVLPLEPASLSRVLVVGRLASESNLGDHGSSRVRPPYAITPLDGLRRLAPSGVEIAYETGNDLERTATLAADADAVLVVVGYDHESEGEFIPLEFGGPEGSHSGGDRADLGLGEVQERMILAAARANPKTVVAVMAGSSVMMENWRREVGAILFLFYPGMEGGSALANVLFGKVSPGGCLPFTIPANEEVLPFFDRDAVEITYDLWHGYTKLERDGQRAAYPFGAGMSYTCFDWSNARATFDEANESIQVEVDVENTGKRDSDVVTQVYAGPAAPIADHPHKRLCGFARFFLRAGESKRAKLEIATKRLAFFDVEAGHWRLAARDWTIGIGSSSDAEDLLVNTLALPPRHWSIAER